MTEVERVISERCILREWQEKDLQDLQEIFCAAETAKLAGFKVRKPADVQSVLKQFIIDSQKSLWAITDKQNNKAIGWIEKHQVDKGVYEIGYCLNARYWGKGIMPEVVQAVVSQMRNTGDVRIICAHSENNEQSKRVVQKCGFSYWKNMNGKVYYDQKL